MAVIKDDSTYVGLDLAYLKKTLDVDSAWLAKELSLGIDSIEQELAKDPVYGPKKGTKEICRLTAYLQNLGEAGLFDEKTPPSSKLKEFVTAKLIPAGVFDAKTAVGELLSVADLALRDIQDWAVLTSVAWHLYEKQVLDRAVDLLKVEAEIIEERATPPPPPVEVEDKKHDSKKKWGVSDVR